MRYIALVLVSLCEFFVQSADSIISGAAYFVIHTVQKSVMYRAKNETIFCAPDFYKIKMSGNKVTFACQQLLKNTESLVTFHNSDTELLEVKRDNNQSVAVDTWRAMLDPAVKVSVYIAQMNPKDKKLQLYDKRGHLIIGLDTVACRDDSSLKQYKEMIHDFADPSLLNNLCSIWNGERTGRRDKVILSYEKRYKIPLYSDNSGTLYSSSVDDSDEDYVVYN